MAPQYPRLKLTHFADGDDRAEVARLAFFVGGVPFEDERVSREEFQSRKSKLPFARLPVLEVDSEILGETNAILRFAGRLGGLYPADHPLAALRIDEVLHGLEEFSEKIAPCLSDATPAELREDLAKREIPSCFSMIDARLETMQLLPYFRDKRPDLLVHELAIYAWVTRLRSGSVAQFTSELVAKFRHVNEAVAKVLAHPQVKNWYRTTHDTTVPKPAPAASAKISSDSGKGDATSLPIPKLKLTYFFLTGRAEPIRLTLAVGDIPFENEQISSTEFAIIKSSLPFGKLPVLHVDTDKPVAQSHAILRYAGMLSGLYPIDDAVEALRIDELLSIIDEGHNDPLLTESYVADHDKKLAMRARISRETIPRMLEFLDRRLDSRSSGPFATGRAMTVADLAIAGLVTCLETGSLEGVPSDIAKPYKNLTRIVNLVNNHPKVQDWRKTHPLPSE